MKLSLQEAKLYFDLMWSLQFFAKEKLKMLPEVQTVEEYAGCTAEEKLSVRAKLFEERELIDAFVAENPQKFADEHLLIAQSWKEAIVGDFYIERMLKRYAIFIAPDDKVYGVLGLFDDFDEMFHKAQLPALVKTILLPFQGKIIYDGLMQGYRVFFGGGIKGNLKETYLTAKQNGRIIESLDALAQAESQSQSSKPQKNWRPELDALAESAKRLRGGNNQPLLNSPTFSLIKASIEFGQLATDSSQDFDELWKNFKKIERSVRKLGDVLYRME